VSAPTTPQASESAPRASTPAVRLIGLERRFGEVAAVDGVDLEIADGEFFSLIGPSGCGKTTTLRMIAGFERPTDGRIVLDGTDVADVPPHRRSVNTVFQSYALFPHLDVERNVAFGLKYKRVTKEEQRIMVREVLEVVQLAGMERRKPNQLSGGQQQRVALARALVLKPRVLLLDEPLGALDARLRKGLQVELKALQSELGITFVFVTHDQEEALTMSDRIAVMSKGRIQQLGSALDVYERPVNRFVADFIGDTNFVVVDILGAENGWMRCRGASGLEFMASPAGNKKSGSATLAIRPEKIRLKAGGAHGEIVQSVYTGTDTNYQVRIGDGSGLSVRVQNAVDGGSPFVVGDKVGIDVPSGAARMLQD
jgi:spermidine/putrescine transport system ATP-binding protein